MDGDDEENGDGGNGAAGARKRAVEEDGDEELAATKRHRSGRGMAAVDIAFEPLVAASILAPRRDDTSIATASPAGNPPSQP